MFFGESGSIAGGMMLDAVVAVHPVGHVGGQVPDGRVVFLDHRLQAGDRRRVRLGEVDVAAPDPVAALLRGAAAQADRLRVVDDDRVPLALQALGVDRVDLVEDLPLLVAQRLLGALQRVVEELGRVEELLLAEDHVPVGVDADVAHQRHDRVEDLRDAAAESGGADVQDALALRAARPARGSARSAPCRRCGCSRRGTSGRVRLPEASRGVLHAAAVRGVTAWRSASGPSGRLPRVTSTSSRCRRRGGPRASPSDPARRWRCSGRGLRGASPCGRRPRGSRRRRCGTGSPGSGFCSSPPSSPASSAGPSGTTSASRPPKSASRPSFSASCG